jgi:hypothetical protein
MQIILCRQACGLARDTFTSEILLCAWFDASTERLELCPVELFKINVMQANASSFGHSLCDALCTRNCNFVIHGPGLGKPTLRHRTFAIQIWM